MYSLSEYSYNLPAELIAQQPMASRDHSNLLCLNRRTGAVSHHRFDELRKFLNPGDVLVINNTEVIPGRLLGKKDTGGKIEVLIADYAGGYTPKADLSRRSTAKADGADFVCRCLVKASKHPKPGTWFYFKQGLKARVLENCNGTDIVQFYAGGDFEKQLHQIGEVPLPPYIRRSCDETPPCDDRVRYQTVYASQKGAIAAPTAGLHFSKALIKDLESREIKIVPITLHVGYGTFLPVRTKDIRQHKMHSERCRISEASADTINSARKAGRRVVAVGTTCVRSLEYASDADGNVSCGSGNCDLFIYPGYRFKAVDAMVTNFHLPQSTLLMLVSAFVGKQKILNAYREAIKRRYRFYSYGDAMFIA